MPAHLVLRQISSLTGRSSTSTLLLKQNSRTRAFVAAAQIAFFAVVLVALSAIMTFAQTGSSGSVVGTVTDQSGAVLPDATVSINDKATNATLSTATNSAGHYVFANVNPGAYDIKITKPGFQTAIVQNQSVLIGQSLTEDVKLTVGAVTQEITVETTGTELQTLNSTVGNTVTGVALESLPSIGGDVSTFITLQPGVAPGGQVAGTVSDQSTFQLDGGNNTSDMDGNMMVYTPSFGGDPTGGIVGNGLRGGAASGGVPTGVMPTPSDSVEEFKVNTANQTADFNSSAGAQVQVVTKRGTNAYHGTAYEYYLDNNFNANSWQNNLNHTPLPSYHYNRFGAAFGGPLIPKDVLGGKTYFFANYQGFRWPNSTTDELAVPSQNMRNGLLTLTNGQTINLAATDPRASTDAGNGTAGINPLVQQFWNKYEPLPNDPGCTGGPVSGSLLGTLCDGINVQGYRANVAIPQNDNFGVVRIDHDFGAKWHFNTSYRYYHLSRATVDQVDIGGFFPGDTKGTPASLSNRPEVPWYLVAGVTTNISTNTTNDFHYSFLRNWWAWNTNNAPAQLAGLSGALEPLGENQFNVLAPYNVNAQQVRTRFWDGKDHYLRDDITMLHGNHLFTFGGAYQHNFNYHQRTDNGGGINFTTTYLLGDGIGAGNVNMSGLYPGGTANSQDDRYMAAMLGIVTDSQVAYTRAGNNLALNPPLTPAYDKSTIPYYNVYFSDSWHLKPTVTLTYGLGWTLEMPPTEQNGKQVILVDSSNQPIQIDSYVASRERAALQGQVYNPQIGFALIGNTANSPKYPYDPFYGEFSPRVAVSWNPNISEGWLGKMFGGDKTVVRAGYGRIFGRLNGVNLVLVPLLGTGLIQAVQCTQPFMPNAVANTPNGSCAPTGAPALTAATAFRVGVDGNTAPLPAAAATLPQPDFPGFNAATAGAGTALDPHTRPNVVDSVDFTIQRQLTNRMTIEFGYIGRYIRDEFLPIDMNAVPYMMTLGGQSFESAYANIETAMGCLASASACGSTAAGNSAAAVMARISPQPFLESALSGTGYCNGFANCTQALVSKQFSNLSQQRIWSLWTALDKGGIGGGPNGTTTPGFNFACTMLNCPINSQVLGGGGQLSSGFGVNTSDGYGNYNAGFVSLKMNNYRGLTLQQNFTYGKALGLGDVTQSSSSITVDDPFHLSTMYGPQSWDRKYIYNLFLVYQPPYYTSQQGFLGHVLGGWNFSPILAAGSGAPLRCRTKAANAQAFGAGDGNSYNDIENCIPTSSFNTGSSTVYGNVTGGTDPNGVVVATGVAKTPNGTPVGVNIFPNPVATFDSVRDPILGIDQRDGGQGFFRGLPYWNLDLSVRKNIKLTERFNTEFQFLFLNVLNHNQFADPTLNLAGLSSFGVINSQGNNPRQMEFGLRIKF